MSQNMAVYLTSCLSLFLVFTHNGVTGLLEVETRVGPVQGVSDDFQGKNLTIFRGIPYAKPPVGRLRFRPPVPVEPWQDTLNATEYGDICPQSESAIAASVALLSHTRMSEDCLTLDIYSPDNTDDELLTVMVFFYPGSFATGTTMLYDGSVLAATQNVVVVTVNYRLGALGFLSTMDKYANGNYGLLDQQLAIRWVKANIDGFGGDPDKITLFGRSAGGMSVGFQMLSPSNDGLFKRGISQSGTATSFFMADRPVVWARRLGSALNCNDTSNHRKLVSCLRTKTWQEIVGNIPNMDSSDQFARRFLPVVDGKFLPETPEHLSYTYLNFTKFDYLLGFNNNEGKFCYKIMKNTKPDFDSASGFTLTEFEEFIGDFIRPYYKDDEDLIQKAVLNRYTDWKNTSSDLARLDNYFKLVGDQLFVSPTVEVAMKHAKSPTEDGKTFLYQFSHDGATINETIYPEWLKGSPHTAESDFVLGATFVKRDQYTDNQRTLSSTVMKYWANFAKTGNPNDGDTVDVTWPEYTPMAEEYLDIDLTVTVDHHPMAADVVFWLDYILFLSSTSCPLLPTNCIDVVGKDLGLSLTLSQTSTLIQAFIAIVIILCVFIFLLCGALCGYHAKVNNISREYKKIGNINERLENVADSLNNGQSRSAVSNGAGKQEAENNITELE